MCGISGHLSFSGAADSALAEAMSARLAHRGPDGSGLHLDGQLALAHRRLAIIDPATGHQPIVSADRRYALVANGEIYNYRELRAELLARGHHFVTQGDCETILVGFREWGINVLARLRGMFAFALWDAQAKTLWLARDRVGIKPLCYTRNSRGFAFASEQQALWIWPGLDRTIDLDALDHYLHLQYVPAPRSILSGIQKLQPGHWLAVGADGHGEGPRRYWRLEWTSGPLHSEEEAIAEIDSALDDAVRSHLVADVPFGAFLSGGVDSSTVVAYAARALSEPLRTFTIGFDVPEMDEREDARAFARRIGTEHQERVVGVNVMGLLPRLARHYGEPFADSSALCTWMVCAEARKSAPMVLSGDGGDEVFAGYNYFPKLVESYRPSARTGARVRRQIGAMLRAIGLRTPAPDLAQAWYERSPFFHEGLRQRLWRPEFARHMASTRASIRQRFEDHASGDVLDRCQSVDIESYLVDDNLAKVDIASMAHGLEVRVPLLDHRLLETVARLPPDLRLRRLGNDGGWCGKYALKRAASQFYPWDWLTRRKRGFSVPMGRWLQDLGPDALKERLLDKAAGLGEWFVLPEIERLIDEHGSHADHGHRLWALLFLAQWRVELHAA